MGQAYDISLRLRGGAADPRRVRIGSGPAHAENVLLSPGAPFDFALEGASHYIALHDIVLDDGEMSVGGGAAIPGADLRRTLTFLPAAVPTRGWCAPATGQHSFTAIYFDDGFVPDVLRSGSWWQEPDVYFRSAELEAAISRLKRGLSRSEPFLPLMGETLCQLAVAELAARAGRRFAAGRLARGLSDVQLRAVAELMEADLGASPALEDMARAAGLSKYHFLRAYKAATGVTPYRAVLDRRIDRAKGLVLAGLSIEQVAADLGFSSPAELSRAFRNRTGLSPTAYRASIQGDAKSPERSIDV